MITVLTILLTLLICATAVFGIAAYFTGLYVLITVGREGNSYLEMRGRCLIAEMEAELPNPA